MNDDALARTRTVGGDDRVRRAEVTPEAVTTGTCQRYSSGIGGSWAAAVFLKRSFLSRTLLSRAFLSGAVLSLAVGAVVCLAWALPGWVPGGALAETTSPGSVESPDGATPDGAPAYLALGGPNDGEPARVGHVRLNARTDWLPSGTLSLAVSGVPLRAQAFPAAALPQGAVREIPIDVPTRDIERVLGRPLDAPDAGPVYLTALLVDRTTGAVLAATSWSGFLAGPWIGVDERVSVAGDGPKQLAGGVLRHVLVGTSATAEQVQLVGHAPAAASYYLVFVSSNAAGVRLSPENPAAYERARVEASGLLSSRSSVPHTIGIRHRLANEPQYVALWIFRGDRGWTRSAVHTFAKP